VSVLDLGAELENEASIVRGVPCGWVGSPDALTGTSLARKYRPPRFDEAKEHVELWS
jgi:hypothetical protein